MGRFVQLITRMENKNLLNLYRGCLVGALVGDCLGSHFENEERVDKTELSEHFNRTEAGKGENIYLTDDTQMTQELADSLIAHKGFNAKDLARRFTNRFYTDGEDAGYGMNVRDVFYMLRKTDFSDPFKPARDQFNGTGSYGNGAAMRVAPVPLFAFPDITKTIEIADQSASVTHTHELGRHGAILQALAIRRALLTAPVRDAEQFLTDLKADAKSVNICKEYVDKLEIMASFLKKGKVSDTEVILKLGNSIRAHESVPTAIFCFLRALQPIPEIPGDCPFRRAVEYAISLEGDTDTIGSMAGAIAGANVGLTSINKNTVESCPDFEKAIAQSKALYDIAINNNCKG